MRFAPFAAVVTVLALLALLGRGDDAPSRTDCAQDRPGAPVAMALPGCALLASDTAGDPDPRSFWGSIDCAAGDRQRRPESGGDTHVRADGHPQGNEAFRRMSVIDGDDVSGERCELGENDFRSGPTVFYREGDRRITFLSVRLPANLQLDRLLWQVVMQMKQTQPSGDSGTPVLDLDALDGRWVLYNGNQTGTPAASTELWSAAARPGVWTRFALDVTYSRDPRKGSVRIYADLDGDGDFAGKGERSPLIHTHTLKFEPGSSHPDALAAGDSLPSHLRVGIYHSPDYACPAPNGCSVDIDNVQVLAP